MSVRLLKTHTIDVSRRNGKGRYEKGTYVYKTESVSDVVGSIQPIEGKDQQYFADFDQSLDRMKIWTKSELKKNDIVNYNSTKYRIFRIKDYTGFPVKINNYECFCIEVPL